MSWWGDLARPIPVVGGILSGLDAGGEATSDVNPAQTDEDRQRALLTYDALRAERAYQNPTQVQTVEGQTVAAPTINTQDADQARQQQWNLVNDLQGQANGNLPSIAESQYQQNAANTAAQIQGQAGAATGTAGIAARRDAMMAIAQNNQQAALGAAQIRAQEQQQAQARLGGVLTGVRSADADMATEKARQALMANTTTAQLHQGAALANQGAGLQGQQITNQHSEALLNGQLQAGQQATGSTGMKLGVQQGNRQNAGQVYGATLGGFAAGAVGLAKSDVTAKTDIHRDSDAAVSRALKAVEMYSYRYKDPANGAGERHGPMAQDLERDPILRTTVSVGPDGKKVVDTSALSLVMAGLAARKLRQLEGRR